jgi:hypothetical protein
MKANVRPLDRAIRCWLGMMILATPLLELHTAPYNLIGIVPLVTGFVGFCPLYLLFGTRGGKETHEATA